MVDKDHDDSISKEELGDLMHTLQIKASQQEIDLMITEIDKNSDGLIQFEEFVAVMSRKVQATYGPDEVKQAFKIFEGDSPPGMIKTEFLRRALKVYGSDKLTDDQVNELMMQIEIDTEGGLFNYDKYVSQMMSL